MGLPGGKNWREGAAVSFPNWRESLDRVVGGPNGLGMSCRSVDSSRHCKTSFAPATVMLAKRYIINGKNKPIAALAAARVSFGYNYFHTANGCEIAYEWLRRWNPMIDGNRRLIYFCVSRRDCGRDFCIESLRADVARRCARRRRDLRWCARPSEYDRRRVRRARVVPSLVA